MATKTKGAAEIAKLMASLDLCMLTTHDGDALHTRPMSNNGEVEFDGDVWFFSNADSRKVREIEADPRVIISYSAPDRGLWLALEGSASIVTDVAKKKELWLEELEEWFEDGPEDDSIVLVNVSAERAEHWGSAGDGIVELG
ncbi:MAG: pyridoxamine 5'-phosphate oxidase family protein [Gemmatimonadaceae bacterium]